MRVSAWQTWKADRDGPPCQRCGQPIACAPGYECYRIEVFYEVRRVPDGLGTREETTPVRRHVHVPNCPKRRTEHVES